jgi:hypothetical protein
MVPDVSTGSYTRGLLAYLYGPGRRDEHTDAHIVAAWDLTGAPDPGRDPDATLTRLAHRLDAYATLRARELGAMPPQHVWHCPVRTAPEDRYLTDAEWAQVARRIVAATGIAPEGDDRACRWIAVRHADDHIHLVATSVRLDGRRARTNRDGWRAQKECRAIEEEFGLRRLKSGDLTAPKTPTSAEQAKAQRQGRTQTAREWLRDQVTRVAAAARTEDEFFDVLGTLGIKVKHRIGPNTGDIIGYAVAAPDDTADGKPVWYGGSKLAPDLSINRIRERLTAQDPADQPTSTERPADPWLQAETAARQTHAALFADDDPAAQAHLAAFGDLLHATADAAPAPSRAELQAAATAFQRATRSAIRAEHQRAAAVRTAAKDLFRTATSAEDGTALAVLLSALVLVAVAASRWHEARGHQQQAAATRQAFTQLQAAYLRTAEPLLADLAQRAPHPDNARRYEAAVRQALPDHADRILTDPAWPALTTTLAKAETAGHPPTHVLTEAAEQRELDTATNIAHVLNWRITATPNARVKAATARSRTLPTRPVPVPAQPTPPVTHPIAPGRRRQPG